jgi:hypothetical protein
MFFSRFHPNPIIFYINNATEKMIRFLLFKQHKLLQFYHLTTRGCCSTSSTCTSRRYVEGETKQGGLIISLSPIYS